MPFEKVKFDRPQVSFEEGDRIICAQVLPNLISTRSNSVIRYYTILPNGRPSVFHSEAGPTKDKNPMLYFALSCLEAGLQYADIGLWLDTCIGRYQSKHADGIIRVIDAEKESSLKFDARKLVYSLNGTLRRYIKVKQVSL